MSMEYEKKILNLFNSGYLTTKSIVNNGIPRIYLTKLVKNGDRKSTRLNSSHPK